MEKHAVLRSHTKGRLIGSLLCLVPVALLASGCSTVSKDRYESAIQENVELRDKIGVLESSVREYDQRNADVTAENQALVNENARLQAQLEQAKTAAVSSQPFGDIKGVNVSTRGGELVVGIAGDVLFDPGSVTLKRSAKATLDKIASELRSSYASKSIRVEGYTDTDPIRKSKWKTNERLSAERAMAVEAYLVSKGINNDAIYSAAFGPAHPKSTKSKSRRVEVVILNSGG
jgi:outer membrane protein OmpA-like peptidoglycan-associated protein